VTRHPYDARQREGWKSYPVRLLGGGVASCHGVPRILVQSLEGGFVSANCPVCAGHTTLPLGEFIEATESVWVGCPVCKKMMKAGYVPDGTGANRNYGFACAGCSVFVWLSDLLPRYQDL
jgi:hypothetical protein